MSSSVKEMLAAANGSVPTISLQDAKALIERGQVLVVDVRDGLEIQSTGNSVRNGVALNRQGVAIIAQKDSTVLADPNLAQKQLQ